MTIRILALAAPLLLAGASALAADAPAALTYEVFEATVPHVDLMDCPEPMAGPERFCRLAAGAGGLHVFAFSYDGDQPMIAVSVHPEDTYALDLTPD